MSKIFVVYAYGGEWEDKWSTNCIATSDKAKAEAWILKEKQNDILHNQLVDKLNEFQEQYASANPMPNQPKLTPLPKKSNPEREQIEAENAAKLSVFHKSYEEYSNLWAEACNDFLKSQGCQESFDTFSSRLRDREFEIEEIELI